MALNSNSIPTKIYWYFKFRSMRPQVQSDTQNTTVTKIYRNVYYEIHKVEIFLHFPLLSVK